MIGVIAGTGVLPIEAVRSIRRQGVPFCIVSLFPEENLQILQHAADGQGDCFSECFYKPSTIIAYLRERGVTDVVLIGKVDKKMLFQKLSFDMLSMNLLASLICKGDRAVMEVVIERIEHEGFRVIAQDTLLGGLLVKPGILVGHTDPLLDRTIAFGMRMAQQMSALDVGQTVIVKDGMVLAVEALEGTDLCMQRGILLGRDQVVVCKAVSYDQNKKYDLPTLGPRSLEHLLPGNVRAFAWLASHTLIAQKELFMQKAQDLGITLVAVGD